MADNAILDNVKSRVGTAVVITLGSDGVSYRGTLLSVYPGGTDTSDAGVSATANDSVLIEVRLNRTKS